MDREIHSFALKSALNEIRTVCPGLLGSFMFNADGEIIAGDEKTSEKMTAHFLDAFDGILEKAETIGGVECITFEGSRGSVHVSCINDIYFVTITSEKTDMNYVNTVTHVLVPTVLKLLDKICPTPLKNKSSLIKTEPEPETPMFNKFEEPVKEYVEKETVEKETVEKGPVKTEIKSEPLFQESPVNQLIVENLGGILVLSDTVRIDSEILSKWGELCEGKKIEELEIETFDGKKSQCKVKPIKDSKYEGRGIIQMPQKIQLALEIKKGELVRARPIIE
jgi:predicted regulator of Ras-like GTPase activity (Roadblock/LC7/MglB family)